MKNKTIKEMLPLLPGDMLYIDSLITDDGKPFMAIVLTYEAKQGTRPFPVIDSRFKHKNAGDQLFRHRKVMEHHISALQGGNKITIKECISKLSHITVHRADE
jgi:hypothetical protein